MAALKHEAGRKRTWKDLVALRCRVAIFLTGAAQAGAERARAGGHSPPAGDITVVTVL